MGAGDIPQVQAEIEAIRLAVLGDWRSRGGQGLEELIRELEEERLEEAAARRRRNTAVAAALLLFARALEEPPSRRFRARARASALRLIQTGIRFAELAGGRLRARGPTVQKAARQAGDELVTLSRVRAQAPRFSKRLRESADDLAASNRELAELDKLTARIDQDRKTEEGRKARRSELEDRRREFSRKRRDSIKDLRKTVTDTNGALSDAISDAWAYRAFNLGAYLAAKSTGLEELVAVNPDDERTTPFCHWVNGKTIKIRRVERQVDAFLSAVRSGDRGGIVSAWPFLAQNPGALRDLRDANGGSQNLGFRRFFAKVGLPPYHFRCRTRALPRFRRGA